MQAGSFSVEQVGLKYTLVPGECEATVTTPASQTEADGDLAKSRSDLDHNDQLKHDLDHRCDWQLHWCGSIEDFTLGIDTDAFGGGTSGGGGSEDTVISLQSNPNPRVDTFVVPDTSYLVKSVYFQPVFGQIQIWTVKVIFVEELRALEWTIEPESGTTSATAAGVEYRLVPKNCGSSQVEPQPNSAGFLNASTGKITHQLLVGCDWEMRYCGASVSAKRGDVMLGTGSIIPLEPPESGSIGSLTLNKGMDTETEDILGPRGDRDYFARLVDTLYHNVSSNPNKAADTLEFTSASSPACPSTSPTVSLHDNSNSGSNFDLITNNSNPTFLVTNVAGGSTVKVTADYDTGGVVKSVTKSITAPATVPANGVAVMFTGSECEDEDDDNTANDSCELDEDGVWDISVTHHDTVANKAISTHYVGIAITVDTTDPTITITPGHPRLDTDPQTSIPENTTITFTIVGTDNSLSKPNHINIPDARVATLS